MTLNNTAKILLIALVVALVAGVWGVRHYQDAQVVSTADSSMQTTSAGSFSETTSDGASSAEQSAPGSSQSLTDGEAHVAVLDADTLDLDQLTSRGLPLFLNFASPT